MARGLYQFGQNPRWAQVDYGAHTAPITEEQYRTQGHRPDFDQLPTEDAHKGGGDNG